MQIRFEPFGVTATVPEGTTILDAALANGVHINASCGGEGVCGKCRVTMEQGRVEGGTSAKLSQSDREKGVVLACRAQVVEDVVVRVPVDSALDTVALKALSAGAAQLAKTIGAQDLKDSGRWDPALRKVVVTAPAPNLSDNRDDVDRLVGALHKQGERRFFFEFQAIRDLPEAFRQGDWTVTATLMRPVKESGHNHVIHVEPGDTSAQNLALAIDVGTTTVWVQLIDLVSGDVLGTSGEFNAQIGYGEDVISRIVYAGKPGGMKRLQDAVVGSINEALKGLARQSGVGVSDINLAIMAGNTTMTQLLLAVEPKYLRLEPYVPTATYYPPLRAKDFGLALPDHVRLLTFPAVASYVGGDVVAGVMGTGMHLDSRLTLFLDMGTNGEVVVGNQDWLACAAASAGPAFEGGGIKFGMRASQGAIENFSVDPLSGEPAIVTVGRTKPRGICGSGLIAAVAAMFITGLIDERGRFNLDHPSQRLRQGEDGPEYVLVWADDTSIGRDITLTEIDIDNLIRAKGAMYAAYMTLLEGVGLSIHDLDRVILAGGFGQSINIERAQLIGLLPEMPVEKFTFVGNGSLLGARLATMSNQLRREVQGIVDKMTNFELSVAPGYMDNYTSSCFLPHTEAKTLFPGVFQRLQQAREAVRKAKEA